MKPMTRILVYFLLPILAIVAYPPEMLAAASPLLLGLVLLLFISLGLLLWNGRSLMLTLAIFLQGLNVIIRLMMFYPNAVSKTGVWHPTWIVTCLLGLAISFWLVLRLDRVDVRATMIK
jgi:hypothetical protein